MFETRGNEGWIVLNSLIFVLESLDYCLGVSVQAITVRSTHYEPTCSVYLVDFNRHGWECYLADVLRYLSDTVLTSLFCLSVAIKDNL